MVVDGTPISRSVQVDDATEVLAGGDRRAILKIRIWRRNHDGIWLAQLVEETGWTKSAIESELADAVRNGEVVRIGEMFMHAPAWELLKSQVVAMVADFHKENPLASGIGKEELRDRTDAGIEAFEAITEITGTRTKDRNFWRSGATAWARRGHEGRGGRVQERRSKQPLPRPG